MTLIIGTDEAGYGPNLGPLVVAATAWRIAADAAGAEPMLEAALTTALAGHDGPLWADSKRIYRGGAGFAALERGALVAAALATGGLPRSWPDLAAAHDGASAEPAAPEAWWLADARVPLEAGAEECLRLAAWIGPRLSAGGATLVASRWRVIQPATFNRFLDLGLNKSDILSQTTLELAAGLVASLGAGPTLLWCDRHGGRRRYAGLLARHFAAPLVRVREETATRSVYDLDGVARVEFSVGGEARTPVAAASMTAKYVREVAMQAFNAHWSGRHPAVAPTAGYPEDAARWRRQAAAAVAAAGIPWDAVWRRA